MQWATLGVTATASPPLPCPVCCLAVDMPLLRWRGTVAMRRRASEPCHTYGGTAFAGTTFWGVTGHSYAYPFEATWSTRCALACSGPPADCVAKATTCNDAVVQCIQHGGRAVQLHALVKQQQPYNALCPACGLSRLCASMGGSACPDEPGVDLKTIFIIVAVVVGVFSVGGCAVGVFLAVRSRPSPRKVGSGARDVWPPTRRPLVYTRSPGSLAC